jgi:Tfp pilus assembly protein PilF
MKILQLFVLTVGLSLSFIGSQALAQTRYEVEGVIYGLGTKPIGNITITLENRTRAQIALTFSDSDGRYHFSGVEAGVYYLIVKPNDTQFQQSMQRIELIDTGRGAGNTSAEKVDFMLRPAPRKDADSVTPGVVFVQEVPAAAEKEYADAMKSLAKSDKDGATRQLKKAIEIFPTYFLVIQQLGLLYVETNDFAHGIALLQKALEINSKAAPSHLGLGIAYVNLNQSKEAIDELNKARDLDAKSFRTHLYLGIAMLNLGELDQAEKSLKQAYALGGPSKAQAAHLYLASIYSTRKLYKQAIDELEAYLRDNPKAANAASVQQTIHKLKAKL